MEDYRINITQYYILISLLVPIELQPQSSDINSDSVKEKPVQYRRGIELMVSYQSYEQDHADKNLEAEKSRLFPVQNTGVWTELNPKVPRVDYVGIYFVNRDTGWAVGDLGTLIKTIDGGKSWQVIETNTTSPILKVRSYNGLIVIASGYDGLLLRSTDGGETFTQVTSGVGSGFDLWGLKIVNDTLGWACGATALLKTTDGGESWQSANTPGYTGNLWWIDFMNESYGFIAADGKVLRTTDGGENWDIIQAGDNAPLYCIDIIDSLHVAAAGYGGTSYRGKNIYSSDGGYTWVSGGPLTFEAVNCIQYVNLDTGYLVMNNVYARKTTNRGAEWTDIESLSDSYEFQLLDNPHEKIGYSAGAGLKINKAQVNFDIWNRLIINDNFSDVYFVNEQKGFTISSSGLSTPSGLYETTNGGINWERISGAPDGVDLLFLNRLTGFIGSDIIYKTTDGGQTWYIPNGGAGGAAKLFFINETTGWAVTSNAICKTTDRGENWVTQFTTSFGSFTSIHFADSLYGWASGTRPYKTTDGGNNWIQQTNTNIWLSRDVFFIDYLNGFFVGELNDFFKTSDGGVTWIQQDPTGFGIARLSTYQDSTIFIIGSKTYRSFDGGGSWNEFTELNGIRITGLNLLNSGFGLAVGELGLIMKYYDSLYVPVELISFECKSSNNNVILRWQTSSELNNQGFEIQRLDVRGQRSVWEVIGFVEGKGTTAEQQFYSFVDKNLIVSKYQYRLRQKDFDGSYKYSDEVEVEIEEPSEFYFSQNYPNPFNSETTIDYKVPIKTFINISLFDIKGEKIRELLEEVKQPGYYSIKLNGGEISSGIYFCHMVTSSGYTTIRKLTILK